MPHSRYAASDYRKKKFINNIKRVELKITNDGGSQITKANASEKLPANS